MPQIVEVLKYVHEIYEDDGLGVALTGDIQVAELRYRELYGNAKKQLEILLVELRQLRTSQPNLRGVIEIIERFLLDFDRLAAAQRVVAVDRDRVVEKEVSRGVLVPVNNVRNELAMSLLVEKLIIEIKRLKKENPNIKLALDDEVGLIFFTELYDRANVNLSSDFQANLKRYTEDAIRRFTKTGGKWTTDHEVMLNTVLAERFAMASAIKYANEEIEKAKSLAEIKAGALREREGQLQALSKTVQELYRSLNELQNSGAVGSNSLVARNLDILGNLVSSSFTVQIGEPTRILGEFEGSGNDFNRLLSFLRERDAEVQVLKTRLVDNEKKAVSSQYSGVDSERTIAALRKENADLSKQIDNYKTQLSQTGGQSDTRYREVELKLKAANSRIQELESQVRSLELQLKQVGNSGITSANTSQVNQSANLVSSQYSSSSSSNRFGGQGATYGTSSGQEPSYGGVAGTATTTSTYQSGSGSTYQTSGTAQRPTGTTTTTTPATGSGSGAYGSYGSGSGAQSGSTSTYGNLSGSRTGTGATGTTVTGTTGATSSTSGYGSRTPTTGATGVTGVTGATTTSGTSGTASYGQQQRTTYGQSGQTGTSSSSGYGTSGTATGYGTSGTATGYGTTGLSGSGASYGQSATSSVSSSGQGFQSSYQRTTGGTGTLGSSGAGSSSGSSYNFQTKKY